MQRTCFLQLLGLTLSPLSAQNYQLFGRLTDPNGVVPGTVATLNGVPGSDFFALGCGERPFGLPSGSAQVDHQPYLLTRSFDPASSPRVRQAMHPGGSSTVELFYTQDHGGNLTPVLWPEAGKRSLGPAHPHPAQQRHAGDLGLHLRTHLLDRPRYWAAPGLRFGLQQFLTYFGTKLNPDVKPIRGATGASTAGRLASRPAG